MIDTVPCPEGDPCNCLCNCSAFFFSGYDVTVGPLVIDENQYKFSYTFKNPDPALSFVIFCIQCPTNKFIASSSNTLVKVTGNPNTVPVTFTQCSPPGCELAATNHFSVEFDFGEETECCSMQGIKVNVNPANTITEIKFELIFTLPTDLKFEFQRGSLKIKSSIIEVVNNLCMPGCCERCDLCSIICSIWNSEKNIINNKMETFTRVSQLILPPGINLSLFTLEEIENKLRLICRLECCTAKLDSKVAKVLAALNSLKKCL